MFYFNCENQEMIEHEPQPLQICLQPALNIFLSSDE
jgi:hypothetical protein